MRINRLIIILFFLSAMGVYAQNASVDDVRTGYRSFEYEKVIRLSDQILKQGNVSDSLAVELYMMQAASYFSLGDENSARNSFRQLIRKNKNFTPDPVLYSPKIISIFNEVRAEFSEAEIIKSAEADSLNKATSIKTQAQMTLRSALVKNIVVPGWGQIQNGHSWKGGIITGAGLAALGGMIYFIADANKKETEYLNERDPLLIQGKYDDYNSAYKTRNVFIISYLAVWLYSQIDLIFFSSENLDYLPVQPAQGLSLENSGGNFSLSFRYSF